MRSGDDHSPVVLVAEQLRRPVPGGIGTYVRSLIRALDDLGEASRPPIELFASRAQLARQANVEAGTGDPLAALGFPVETAPFGARVSSVLWGSGVLRGYLGSVSKRAALTHALSFSVPSTKAPLVVTVHDLAFRAMPEAFTTRGRRWHEQVLRRVANEAASLVVPSNEVADELLAAGLSIEPGRVRVIPEGADHLAPEDPEQTSELLHRHAVGGRFVLVVGTLEPRKNLARVVEAFTIAKQRGLADYSLVICGPSGWKTELGEAPGVVAVGRVPARVLSGLYRRARAVVYAPLYEGFGLPAVEAMAMGAVVVSSRVPSASSGAFTVEPTDPASIADGIYRCCTDENLREKLSSAGREHVKGLTWEQTARDHIELWNGLIVR